MDCYKIMWLIPKKFVRDWLVGYSDFDSECFVDSADSYYFDGKVEEAQDILDEIENNKEINKKTTVNK